MIDLGNYWKIYETLVLLFFKLENEYGSFFTCDMEYREHLRDKLRSHLGSDAVLITTDGAGLGYLKCGAVDGVYATVDFGPGLSLLYILLWLVW